MLHLPTLSPRTSPLVQLISTVELIGKMYIHFGGEHCRVPAHGLPASNTLPPAAVLYVHAGSTRAAAAAGGGRLRAASMLPR